MKDLKAVIEEAERSTLHWGYVAATFLAMVLARNLLEGALGPNGSIGFVYSSSPSSLMVLDHFVLFYASLFLSFTLLLSALTRERVGAVARVMTPAWALLLVPPLLDYVVTSGEGMKITYLLELRPVILRVFDPRASLEVISMGQRVEMLGACLLAAVYVRIKTRSWIKTILGFAGIYLVLAAHGVLPSLFARASLALAKASTTAELAYFSVFRAGGIVADESRKLALVFLVTTSALAWSVYMRHAPEKARAIARSFRPLRALHYVGLTAFGIALGWTLFSRYGVEFAGPGDVLGMLAACLATLCAFQASVAVNDIFDEDADRLSDGNRPLVLGTLGRVDLVSQAIIFGGAALLFAINVKYSTFLFMLLALIISLAYSAPPIRLKRFPVVSSLTLGLASLAACLVGFSTFAAERALALFPNPLAWVIVLAFGLGFAAKDLKDVEGDGATGVRTLPVLLGPAVGRVAVAVLVFLGYLVVALLLPYRVLAIPAVLLGLASAAAVLVWRRPQLAEVLLAVCMIFTAAVAFVSLTNVDPLLERAASADVTHEALAAEYRAGKAEAWNDLASASSDFTEAAAVLTDDAEIQLHAGAALFKQERYREALPYLARAADLDRTSPVALEYLVKAELKLGRHDSAEWLLFEAVRNGMRPWVFHNAMGEHRMETGRPGAAAGQFQRALRVGAPELPTSIRLVDGLLAAGQPIRARTACEIAVDRRPSSAEAWDALGRCRAAEGEFERAVRDLEEAVRLDPDHALYRNNLGAAYRMAGRSEDALRAIDEAVRLDPRAPEPYYNRGLTLDALGRTDEARRQFLLALEADPLHEPARAALERVSH